MKFKDELEKTNATDEEIAQAVDSVRDSIPGASMFRFTKDWGFSTFGIGIAEGSVMRAADALGASVYDNDSDCEPLPGKSLSRQIEDKMNAILLNKLA
jgi:hypothetical protein